jgi:hypothetical protein
MDFEFPRGDTKIFKFNLKDKNGEELSLSNTDKLFFTVKKSTKTDIVIFQKTLGNGIEYQSDNYYHVTINSDDTAELPYGTYMYDIELKTATGIVKTLILGTITLTDEVTWKGDEN